MSSEPQTAIRLNCLVLGDDTSQIFPITIPPEETVGTLKKLIKEEKQHAFDGIDADRLKLWHVSDLITTFGCWRSDILEGQ